MGEWGHSPTSSLFRAVESQVVFLGFRSGTHSPPRSKVITDWMELSVERKRKRWRSQEDAQHGVTPCMGCLAPAQDPDAKIQPYRGGVTLVLGLGGHTETFREDAGDVDAPQRGDVGEVGLAASRGVEVPLQGLGVDNATVIRGVDGAEPRVCKRDAGSAVREGASDSDVGTSEPPGKRRNP